MKGLVGAVGRVRRWGLGMGCVVLMVLLPTCSQGNTDRLILDLGNGRESVPFCVPKGITARYFMMLQNKLNFHTFERLKLVRKSSDHKNTALKFVIIDEDIYFKGEGRNRDRSALVSITMRPDNTNGRFQAEHGSRDTFETQLVANHHFEGRETEYDLSEIKIYNITPKEKIDYTFGEQFFRPTTNYMDSTRKSSITVDCVDQRPEDILETRKFLPTYESTCHFNVQAVPDVLFDVEVYKSWLPYWSEIRNVTQDLAKQWMNNCKSEGY